MADDDEKKSPNDSGEEVDSSKRRFLKNSGYVAGGLVGGGVIMGLFNNPFETEETPTSENDKSAQGYNETRMFFTRFDDFQVLEAATERIFPEDENGPGAIGLDVPYFIDKQLAGDFGSNKKDYMNGPAQDVDFVDTYQTLMNRGDVILEGLRKIDAESQDRNDKKFYNAEGEQQDEILQDAQNGDIKMDGVRSNIFFGLLRKLTIEGAYADPMYGGNKDMQGWKMREYPGVKAGYIDVIESEEFQKIEPTSLRDYQRHS